MGKVKAARVISPRIVQPGDGSRPWLWLLLLVALAAWSWQVFEFGQQRAGYDSGRRDSVEDTLRERIEALEQERDQLRADAARFERSGQIDRAAAEGVREDVKALQQERAELKREVAFLKSLVSGGGGESKLALDQQSLTSVGEDLYEFEITLSKRTADDTIVSGEVVVSVAGEVDGEEKELDMKTITDGSRSNIGIRFKNFQKLKTSIKLPKGFVPASVNVVVRPKGKAFKSFEQSYAWTASDA